jgi:hypothetical protein
MILKTTAFAVLNGDIPSNDGDKVEAFQFVVDMGYTEELTAAQLLILRNLVESDKVFTPTLFMPL